MVSQAAYYSTSSGSDGGRRYNPHRPSYPPYHLEYPGHERRFHQSPSHDARPATMTDQQMDIDSAPQRKRIAVACGRCRKRKIRCSGDVGNGEACLNCKNAGADQCLFLRVQSREAPFMAGESSELHVGYPRGTASPGPPTHGLTSYASSDGSMTVTPITYPESPAPAKSYYPGPSYSPHYADEFDHYGTGQPMLHDGMMPSQWARKPYTTGSLYMEPASYAPTGYGSGTPLVHRPAPAPETPSSLSLSGFGADLPSASATPQPGGDRLLPNPAIRPPPYAPTKSPQPHSGATLADIASAASAASYVGNFDTPSSSSSSNSMSYTTPASHRNSNSAEPSSEGLFSEHERSAIQSQGPGLDFGGYTSESRRDSGGGGGGTLANGHAYVPSESLYAPSPHHPQYHGVNHGGYGHHQHHSHRAAAGRATDARGMGAVGSRR